MVLVGSPYANSVAAQGMARFTTSRGLLGRTIQDWLRQPRPPLPDGVEVGVIAGDVSIGLGRLVARLPKPNDGVVILHETHVPGATDSIVLHTSHSAMLVAGGRSCHLCVSEEGRLSSDKRRFVSRLSQSLRLREHRL